VSEVLLAAVLWELLLCERCCDSLLSTALALIFLDHGLYVTTIPARL
jgi:hypothetical protein